MVEGLRDSYLREDRAEVKDQLRTGCMDVVRGMVALKISGLSSLVLRLFMAIYKN